MGWIDWAQTPPDQNMGIVRDVLVRRSGPVALRGAHVVTNLTLPSLNHADLTAKVDVRNDSAAAVTTTVAGNGGRTYRSVRRFPLRPRRRRPSPSRSSGSTTRTSGGRPGWAGSRSTTLDLTATTAGTTSDSAHASFGVRDVKAPLNSSGGRAYSINGRPLLVKGGGWSPDLFLRWNATYAADKLKYVRDLGLNTVRLEGHIEPDEFFDLADQLGILTMPGWECCDKWEGQVNGGENGNTWTAEDYVDRQVVDDRRGRAAAQPPERADPS